MLTINVSRSYIIKQTLIQHPNQEKKIRQLYKRLISKTTLETVSNLKQLFKVIVPNNYYYNLIIVFSF